MKKLERDTLQQWLTQAKIECYVCPDCEGLHLTIWEAKEGVLESRLFVDDGRLSMLTEIAIRPSAVLPLQGAVHFMNYDYGFLKVMLAMADNDVPRLLLNHALPNTQLNETQVIDWLTSLQGEMDAVFKHLAEMDVIYTDDADLMTDYDDQLH